MVCILPKVCTLLSTITRAHLDPPNVLFRDLDRQQKPHSEDGAEYLSPPRAPTHSQLILTSSHPTVRYQPRLADAKTIFRKRGIHLTTNSPTV